MTNQNLSTKQPSNVKVPDEMSLAHVLVHKRHQTKQQEEVKTEKDKPTETPKA